MSRPYKRQHQLRRKAPLMRLLPVPTYTYYHTPTTKVPIARAGNLRDVCTFFNVEPKKWCEAIADNTCLLYLRLNHGDRPALPRPTGSSSSISPQCRRLYPRQLRH
eukprot:scaffold81317_cov68-Cyclotella_meneghiniana.AAC.2